MRDCLLGRRTVYMAPGKNSWRLCTWAQQCTSRDMTAKEQTLPQSHTEVSPHKVTSQMQGNKGVCVGTDQRRGLQYALGSLAVQGVGFHSRAFFLYSMGMNFWSVLCGKLLTHRSMVRPLWRTRAPASNVGSSKPAKGPATFSHDRMRAPMLTCTGSPGRNSTITTKRVTSESYVSKRQEPWHIGDLAIS